MRGPLVHIALFLLIVSIGLTDCKQAYQPPAITAANRYLVVDGVINTGPNSITSIDLNRTQNLGADTTAGFPELKAQVRIVGNHGASYPLSDTAGDGIYTSTPLTLDTSQQYAIDISTADGRKYASDFVVCKPTPPFDSVYYRQPSDLTIYVDSHDPANNTRYYRYQYNETWEHDAEYQTPWTVVNGMIVPQDSTNQKNRCWTSAASTNVVLCNSARLSQDVISACPITTIPYGDPKITIRYSILVSQYALTGDAYNYWQLIQKTSDNVGTLFDLQPTQLIGNFHCLTNASEPVIGYLSASTIQQQRIFIYNTNLNNWGHNESVYGCDSITIPVNPQNPLIYTYQDTFYTPWYFNDQNGALQLVLGSRFCMDCTLFGGTNIKPSFWPF